MFEPLRKAIETLLIIERLETHGSLSFLLYNKNIHKISISGAINHRGKRWRSEALEFMMSI